MTAGASCPGQRLALSIAWLYYQQQALCIHEAVFCKQDQLHQHGVKKDGCIQSLHAIALESLLSQHHGHMLGSDNFIYVKKLIVNGSCIQLLT